MVLNQGRYVLVWLNKLPPGPRRNLRSRDLRH